MKRIILFCPGNLNFGDNAILFTWLEFLDSILLDKDEVTILGCETAYIEPFLRRFRYRTYCTSLLHHYVWKHGVTEDDAEACLNAALQDQQPQDVFEPMPNLIPEVFRNADYVHILGGGILNSMWVDVQYQVKLVVSLAKKYGKKVLLTGQTIGPLDAQGEKNLSSVFQDADLCDLRDTSCFNYVQSQNPSAISTVDDVFIHLMSKGNTQSVVPMCISQMAEQEHINVCIQQWHSVDESVYQTQLEKIAVFLDQYLWKHPNCRLYLLEFMPLDNDLKMANQLLTFLGEEYRTRTTKLSLPNFYPFDASRILETANLNIGSRFHMALFSLAANIPTLSFYLDEYYEHKFQGLEDLFHCKFTLPFETFCVDDIWEMVKHKEISNSCMAWEDQTKQKMMAYYNACWCDGLSLERFKFLCSLMGVKCGRKTF